MRVAVRFGDEQLELDVPDERLIAEWHGPQGTPTPEVEEMVLAALEHPRQYPPLRQALVPDDQVVIAFDPEVSQAGAVLGAICRTLNDVGVGGITVVVPPGMSGRLAGAVPEGVVLIDHDPEDRGRIAYLASTSQDRRVYLNRLVTDADFVLPVGRLGYAPVLGYRGPWSALYPDLSDLETVRSFRSMALDEQPDRERPSAALSEVAEVSWLLGSQFHVGVVSGVSGPLSVVAGLESAVREQGIREVDQAWRFQAETGADLVLAGIGRPGVPTRIEDLVEGLATAGRLVRRGGKIVALSRAEGVTGPALRRLIDSDVPRLGSAPLRGHESDPDYPVARLLAGTLAWADVYVLSSLGSDIVEDLSMIPLERPEEARRLVSNSASCILVSQAELTHADVADAP